MAASEYKLFIGALPEATTEEDLRPLFAQFGDVASVHLMGGTKAVSGHSSAFVVYTSAEGGQAAIDALDHKFKWTPEQEQPIKVSWARNSAMGKGAGALQPQEFVPTENKLWVGSLPQDVTDEELRSVFGCHGQVTDVHIMLKPGLTGHLSAFVTYASKQSGEDAIAQFDNQFKIREGEDQVPIRVHWSKSALGKGSKGKGGKGDPWAADPWGKGGAGAWGAPDPWATGPWAPAAPWQAAPPAQSWNGGWGPVGGCSKGKQPWTASKGPIGASGSKGWGGQEWPGGPRACMATQAMKGNAWDVGKNGKGCKGHKGGEGKDAGKGSKGGTRLFIGNLPNDIDEQNLTYIFANYGQVAHAFIMQGRSSSGQACAFVEMATPDQAETAILTLHDKYEVRNGEGPIIVRYANEKRQAKGKDNSYTAY